jgi:2-polyprenyl-6-hydroxyphenyl methylase/3-demethylubiquinone-9 3-methyltransferase
MIFNNKESIEAALLKVEEIVTATNNGQDIEYFRFHKKRFERMATTIVKRAKPGALILDIGSHYLHSSLLLTFLGYKVQAMDVGVFTELNFVQERIKQCQLHSIIENDLTTLSAIQERSDEYDIILFTEILEHITFNPIDFWKHIYRLLKNQGFIYITTPNSLTIYNIIRTLKNLLLLKGVGINLDMIFGNVTYGHHWKEYSASEIRKYFGYLSDGFKIDIATYRYKYFPSIDLRWRLRNLFYNLGNLIPFFRDELEAVVELDKSKPWKAVPPKY